MNSQLPYGADGPFPNDGPINSTSEYAYRKALQEQQRRFIKELTQAMRTNSDQTWTGFAIEMGIALVAFVLLVVGFEFKQLTTKQDGITSRILGTTFQRPLVAGDSIGPYKIERDYGEHLHPVHQVWKMHHGVDLPTETGVRLFAPTEATIECYGDAKSTEGYGLLAIIKPHNSAYPHFRAGHLSKCIAGPKREGEIFAKTGNSGISTGPHLHWEQRDPATGVSMVPARGWLWQSFYASILGEPGNPVASDPVERLYAAIAAKESGNDPTQVNVDTQASGLTQIIPENIEVYGLLGREKSGGWDKEILGRDISFEELQNSPDLQYQISMGKLEQYWEQELQNAGGNEGLAARRVAALWYSGDADLHDSRTPQILNGNEYPSIGAYADDIEQNFYRPSGSNSRSTR